MDLFATAEVVEKTGVGYRRLLQMLEENWFRPAYVAGEARKTYLFDRDDVWLLVNFMNVRDHFATHEWKPLTQALDNARNNESHVYVVKLASDGLEETCVRTLDQESVQTAMKDNRVRLLVALEQKQKEATA